MTIITNDRLTDISGGVQWGRTVGGVLGAGLGAFTGSVGAGTLGLVGPPGWIVGGTLVTAGAIQGWRAGADFGEWATGGW